MQIFASLLMLGIGAGLLGCAIIIGLFLDNDAGARLAVHLATRRLQQALAA